MESNDISRNGEDIAVEYARARLFSQFHTTSSVYTVYIYRRSSQKFSTLKRSVN